MSDRAVVVTGVGVVSPFGTDVDHHFDCLVGGKSAAARATEAHFSWHPDQMEARVVGFDRRTSVQARMLRKLLTRSGAFAVGAAGAAIRDAGLADDQETLEECGLYVGSLSLEVEPEVFIPALRASIDEAGDFDISLFARRGMRLLDPLFLVRALPNAGICGISVEHQVLGPNTNLTNGTTSGLMAIGLAMAAIARGEVACAIAGGYDTLLVMDSIAEHLIRGRLSTRSEDPARACRPFDRTRDGYVLGEGAAFVLLESAEHAAARGVAAHAELTGYAETADPSLLRSDRERDGTPLAHAARTALAQAAQDPDDLGALFVDGLGTLADDAREAAAAAAVLDGRSVPLTGATGAIGFTGAASGAFNLVHAVSALRRHLVPPLITCTDLDPECPIEIVDHPRPLDRRPVLVWNSDRGVKNVAVVVAPPPTPPSPPW